MSNVEDYSFNPSYYTEPGFTTGKNINTESYSFDPSYYLNQAGITTDYTDKASFLAQRKEKKINDLQKKINPRANLEKSFTPMSDGTFEYNENKIWNNMDDAEFQALTGVAIQDNALIQKDGELYFAKDGRKYDGDAEWLYMGQGKQDPNIFKIGIARGDLDSPAQRYIPNKNGTYGWESGPQGVDPSSINGILLPFSVAKTLEGLAHGRETALQNRVAKNGQPGAEESLGSGYTEYYNGGSQGVFGDSRDDGSYSIEAIKNRWNEYFSPVQKRYSQSGIVDEELFKKAIKREIDEQEADHMGVMDRIGNAIKAVPTAIGKELVLDGLDALGETAKKKLGIGFDLGTDQEKMDMVSNLFGYNQVLAERGSQKAKEHATRIFEGLTEENKDVEFNDVKGLVQAGLETPEMLGYSLGYLASLFIGFGIFTKAGKAISAVEKGLRAGTLTKDAAKAEVAAIKASETVGQLAARVGLQNVGLATVIAGNVNDQIDEYKKNNNGVGPTDTQVIRMLATEGVMASLDRFTDLSILRTPEALKKLAEAAKFVPENKAAELATKVVTGAAKLTAAAGVEAAQEYTQTMGEIFNKQFQSEKYGDNAMAILTSPENVIEGISAAGMGAAMGGEMKAANMAVSSIPSITNGVSSLNKITSKQSKSSPKTIDIESLKANEEAKKVFAENLKNIYVDFKNNKINAGNAADYLPRLEEISQMRSTLKDFNPEAMKVYDASYKEMIDYVNSIITKPEAKDEELVLNRVNPIMGAKEDSEEETETEYTPEQRKIDAEKILHLVLEEREGEITPDLYARYSRFAKANGVEEQRFNNIIKSYESVEEEATVGNRGWKSYGTWLDTQLSSGKPNSKAIQHRYEKVKGWYSTTLSSIDALERGIQAAEQKAETLNKTPITAKKSVKIATDYKKHNGENYTILVSFDNNTGKWVAHTGDALQRKAHKENYKVGLEALLSKFNSHASPFISKERELGTLYLPEDSSTGNDKVQRYRKMDIAYVANQEKALSEVTGSPKRVNKVILESPIVQVGNKTYRGRDDRWKNGSDYQVSNSSLINMGTQGTKYTEDDVVLLHAPGTYSFKKNGFDITASLLGTKNSIANKELMAAIASGASIILDNGFISKNNVVRTRNGKKVFLEKRGTLNVAGKKAASILEENGYVKVPGSTGLFVKVNEDTQKKIDEIQERVKQEIENKRQNTRNYHRLLDLMMVQKALEQGVLELSPVQQSTLKENIEKLEEKVIHKFERKNLEVLKDSDDHEEKYDVDNLGNDEEVSVEDGVELEEVKPEDADIDLSEEIKNLSDDTEQDTAADARIRMHRHIERKLRNRVKENLDTRTKMGDDYLPKVLAKPDVLDKEMAEYAADQLASAMELGRIEEDKNIKAALVEWNVLAEKGLEGAELYREVVRALEAHGIKANTFGENILNNTWTKNFPSVTEGVIEKGKGTETRLSTTGKFNVTESRIDTRRSVELDPSKYLASGDKAALFDLISIEHLPVHIQEAINEATDALQKVIAKPTKKGDIDAQNQNVAEYKYLAQFHDSPASTLVFTPNGGINRQVVGAMYFSIMNMLKTDMSKLLKGYKNDHNIAAMFGVREELVTQEMRALANKHGALVKTLATSLGKDILKQLNLKNKKDTDVAKGHYEAMAAELGNMALLMAESMGLVERTSESSNEIAQFHTEGDVKIGDPKVYFVNVASKAIQTGKFVRHEPSSKVQNYTGMFQKFAETLPVGLTKEVWPRRKAPSEKRINSRLSEVRNDITGVHQVPEEAKIALRNMMETEYILDAEGMAELKTLLENDRDKVKALLGYIPIDPENEEYQALSYEQKSIQEAINRDVERSLEVLEQAYDNNMHSMYFDFSFTGNGRYMIDSNTINPQTDKLHRFIVQPKSHRLTHTVTRKENGEIRFFADGVDTSYFVRIALAQAFGIDIDKGSTHDIMRKANGLLSLSLEEIRALRAELLAKGKASFNNFGEIKVETAHLSHTLQGLRFLEAVATGNQVTSSLTAEFDSLTSGFANKMNQMPILNGGNVDEYLARIGVINTKYQELIEQADEFGGVNTLLGDVGANKGFLDSYKNLAKDALIRMARIIEKEPVLKRVLKSVQSAIPGAKILGPDPDMDNIAGLVDKEMRALFKSPFMIFNYSASISTITNNLSHNLVKDIFEKLAKGDDKAKALAAEMVTLNVELEKNGKYVKPSPADLIEFARTEPITSRKLRISSGNGTTSYYNKMHSAFKAAYGKAVEETFNEQFKEFIEVQQVINDSFKISFRLFNVKFLKRFNEIQEEKHKEGKGVSDKDIEGIVRDLWTEFPWIKGPLSKGMEDVIPIVDSNTYTDNIQAGRKAPQTHLAKGASNKIGGIDPSTRTLKINPIINKMVEAAQKGSVLPFHFIDGAELGTAMNEFVTYVGGIEKAGFLPIHDAIMVPLHMSDAAGWLYNKKLWEINRDYSLVDSLKELTDKWAKSYEVLSDSDKKNISTNGLSITKKNKMSFAEAMEVVQERLTNIQKIVRKQREILHKSVKSGKYVYNNMIGTYGQMYRFGETAPRSDYTERMADAGLFIVKKEQKPTENVTLSDEENMLQAALNNAPNNC